MRRVDAKSMLKRLRSDEGGFGLIELVAAMGVLSIGILALLVAFNSSATVLARSARVSTASVLAERQLELYHALPYVDIQLAADSNDSAYAADRPYPGAPVVVGCANAALPECMAIQPVTGPDGRSYRIDTYIVEHAFAESAGAALRPVRVVRVVVRNGTNLAQAYVTRESTFDESAAI